MARKQSPGESDMTRLKTKITDREKASKKADGDAALRSLRKRLKRAQRKQRAVASRKAHASGKNAEAKPVTAS
jgi:hypothetical protein